ncbi:hypothetical protein ZWY2020_028250 [Hordeum vulgare]|nr:hypothetical protein ZWY2020_028250 [Hordeum vulgare]
MSSRTSLFILGAFVVFVVLMPCSSMLFAGDSASVSVRAFLLVVLKRLVIPMRFPLCQMIFAEDDDYPFSEDGDMDDAEFDKALYDLYVTHVFNCLKRKLSCAATRNVKFKRSSDFPAASSFTRYSGKLFSSCIAGLSPRQHPPVSFFANKLKSTTEEMTDEDIFTCFMCVAFSTFLCPNSSLSPSPKYLHIFRDCSSSMSYDLSRFVYGCLLTSIKKFKDSTKVASNRSVTFGGCYYAFAVSYLDNVHFGLNALRDIKPRILVWGGNKVKHFSDLDKCNSRLMSGEKFSCSKGRDVATSKIPFANNTTTSEVNAPAGSNVSFAYKVESAYASCLGNEVVKQIIDLVQKSNADKPIMFQDWSESLVLNVLGLIGDSAFKSPIHSRAEYPLDSKEDSPTFKNSVSHNLPGCKSVPIESTKKASDDPSVSKLARNVMPDDCPKTNLSIPPLGTDVYYATFPL